LIKEINVDLVSMRDSFKNLQTSDF